MANERIGIWFVGAWGGVSTTAAVGLAALKNGLTDTTGLVSALPRFAELELAEWDRFTIGGHEIRDTSYAAEARGLYEKSRLFTPELLDSISGTLAEFDRNVRTGTLIHAGSTIESLAGAGAKQTEGERPAAAVDRISADLQEFRENHKLDHVIVVHLASTEPSLQTDALRTDWAEVSRLLDKAEESPLPASSLYGAAAMLSDCSFLNFTPSIGSDIPALKELAEERGVLHMGRDGKTGETLLKSVLAPMFASRNLNVMSWVGHNIFGNMDGRVLDDPVNKASKVHSKDHLLTEILGYKPQTHVSIEFIESMADWKTAWDHIHFQGFLDTQMAMQFTWQGCDSILAAPLVLDLVRFTERERRRGGRGVMTHLSSFFKSPMDTDVAEFHRQYLLLERWAAEVVRGGGRPEVTPAVSEQQVD